MRGGRENEDRGDAIGAELGASVVVVAGEEVVV